MSLKSGDKKGILFVEDEPVIALNQTNILKKYGFEVTPVNNGGKALELIKNGNKFDLILMDIDLGRKEMDGAKISEIILKEFEIPVIFHTAHAEEEYAARVSEIANYGYVLKNSGEFVLIESINMALKLYEAQQKVKEREKDFASLIENAPDMIVRFDSEFRHIYCNKAVEQYLGVSKEIFLGKTPLEIEGPKNHSQFIHNSLQKALDSKTVQDVEQPYPTAQGIKYFWTRIIPENDENGEVESLLAITRDVTDRKYHEKALYESEKKYKSLIDNSPYAIAEVGLDGIVYTINKTMASGLGYTVEEVQGKHITNFFPKNLLERRLTYVKKAIDENQIIKYEDESEGRIFTHILVPNKENEVPTIQIISADVTEERKAEKELIHEKEINTIIAEISKIIISPDIAIEEIAEKLHKASLQLTGSQFGYVSAINQETGDNIGYTLSEMMNTACKVEAQQKGIVFPKSPEGYEGLWGHPLNIGEGFYTNNPSQHESSKGIPEGHIHIDNFLSVPAIFQNSLLGQIALANKPEGFTDKELAIIQRLANIYAIALFRNQNEEELVEAKERAEEADKLKSTFLASMSHEIRTPLNAIVGFLDIVLQENTMEEEAKTYLEYAKESGNILSMLINDILDFSKIEANQLKLEKVNFSLESVLNNIEAIGKMLIGEKKKKIQLRRTSADATEIVLLGDAYRLEQVLINLISNAVKFTENGFIEYGFEIKDDNAIEFYVRDTGIGIAEEQQKIIFEPFRQAEEKTTRKYGGTGLGLSISKKLIEMMGGSIDLQSTVGEGTTCYFTVPFVKGEKDKMKADITKAAAANLKTMKILVAEDNRINQMVIRKTLEKLGCEVLIADDGRDAISLLKSEPDIGLILMDMYMPHLDGIEATKVIRKMEKEKGARRIPIIGFTASTTREDRKLTIDAGCDDVIMKPVQRELLINIIKKWSS